MKRGLGMPKQPTNSIQEAAQSLTAILGGQYTPERLRYEFAGARFLAGFGLHTLNPNEWFVDYVRPTDEFTTAATFLREAAAALFARFQHDPDSPPSGLEEEYALSGLVHVRDGQSDSLIADLIESGKVSPLGAVELTRCVLGGSTVPLTRVWDSLRKHAQAPITPRMFAEWKLAWIFGALSEAPKARFVRRCKLPGCDRGFNGGPRYFVNESGHQKFCCNEHRQMAVNLRWKSEQKRRIRQQRARDHKEMVLKMTRAIAVYRRMAHPPRDWKVWLAKRCGVTPKFVTRVLNRREIRAPQEGARQ